MSNELCPAGRDEWGDFLDGHPAGRGVLPAVHLSLGYLHQNETLKFLRDAGGGSLVDAKAAAPSWRAVAYAAFLPGARVAGQLLTLEARVRRADAWTPSDTTARWCVPAGVVPRPDGSGSDPAQACTDRPLGAPAIASTVQYAAAVGIADGYRGFWRGAVGVYHQHQLASERDVFGLEAPLYLNFASAPDGYGGDYKGILRLVPSVEWRYAPSGREVVGFLRVELLGQRSLFADALDF